MVGCRESGEGTVLLHGVLLGSGKGWLGEPVVLTPKPSCSSGQGHDPRREEHRLPCSLSWCPSAPGDVGRRMGRSSPAELLPDPSSILAPQGTSDAQEGMCLSQVPLWEVPAGPCLD